jgi:hypothetical protein
MVREERLRKHVAMCMVREERLRKHVAMRMVREERQNRITQESPHPRRLLILSMWTDILPKTCMHGRG